MRSESYTPDELAEHKHREGLALLRGELFGGPAPVADDDTDDTDDTDDVPTYLSRLFGRASDPID